MHPAGISYPSPPHGKELAVSKKKGKITNAEWRKKHPEAKWVLRHATSKKATKTRKGYRKGDIFRGPDTYKKMLAILRAEEAD